jgi:hypothetical protein
LDVHGYVFPVLRLDGLADIVEEECLCNSSSDISLEPEVVVASGFDNSLHWESGSNVEWSVDMETEILIKSFSSNLLCFVNIDDRPSLVSTVVSLPGDNFLSFSILSTRDIKCLLVLDVDEVATSVPPDLPPVRVS